MSEQRIITVFEIPAGPLAHRQQLFSRACNFENLLVRWASNFFQAFFPSHHTYCRLSQVYGLLVLTDTFDRKQQQPNLFSTKKNYPADKISDMAPLDFTVPGLYQRNRQKDRVSGTQAAEVKGWMPQLAEKG